MAGDGQEPANPLCGRPDVRMCGWLSKEGAHTLSRAFPSRRFCVLVDGRLEYYEERSVLLSMQSDGSSGVELTDWNLVVHVPAHGRPGLAVGDIVTAVDGVELGPRKLNTVISSHAARLSTPFKLKMLRPKGEVALVGACVEAIGRDRMQVTPSPREVLDTRPPYVFIADCESTRDDWLDAVRNEASGMESERHGERNATHDVLPHNVTRPFGEEVQHDRTN